MAPDKDIKLNFDGPPEKETISPDRNCSICYGKGTILVISPTDLKYSSITKSSAPNFKERECPCIELETTKLYAKARPSSPGLSSIFKGKNVIATNKEGGTLKLTVKDKS